MFRPKGLFADITCPYNQECVLPHCLFAHRDEAAVAKTASEGNPVSTTITPDPTAPIELLENDGPQRKKRKVEASALAATALKQETNITKKTGATTASSKTNPPSSKPLVTSDKRAVSPPPTKRPSALSKAENGGSKAPAATKPKPAIAQKPLKAETLNPRLLAKSKTPHNIRLKLVQLLHDQLKRLNTELSKDASDAEQPLVLSPQALITMALDLEERAGIEKPAVHSSVVKNLVMKYKKMSVKDWMKERQDDLDKAGAKAAAAEGKMQKEIKPIETGLPRDLEIALLSKLITPTPSEHGFVNQVPSEVEIKKAKSGIEAAQGWEQCDRCRSRFQVFPERRESDGALSSNGPCKYHFGKAFFPDKTASDVKGTKKEKRYRCCGEGIGDSSGCTVAETHVFKVTDPKRLATTLNFIHTPENSNSKVDEDQPLCIDCEMGYSTNGLELIRVSATSWPTEESVLDLLVRPFGEVLDLNSRWSGVLPSHLTSAPVLKKNPKTGEYDPEQLAGTDKLYAVESPKVAREVLLRILTPRTPLIFHGGENDLNALRLLHPTVIDTALLFPHSHGLPYRNALRVLVSQHLGRQIQAGGGLLGTDKDTIAAGHDSKEDARAAGELVLFAVKREWEKMKLAGWTLEDGRLVPPKGVKRKVDEIEKVADE